MLMINSTILSRTSTRVWTVWKLMIFLSTSSSTTENTLKRNITHNYPPWKNKVQNWPKAHFQFRLDPRNCMWSKGQWRGISDWKLVRTWHIVQAKWIENDNCQVWSINLSIVITSLLIVRQDASFFLWFFAFVVLSQEQLEGWERSFEVSFSGFEWSHFLVVFVIDFFDLIF